MKTSEFAEYVTQDLLSELTSISSRAMFGGYGIYKDGIILGIIAEDQLYFKVDETNKKQYEELNSTPFTYEMKKNKKTTMSYWLVPDSIMDNKQEVAKWALQSYEINRNKKVKK